MAIYEAFLPCGCLVTYTAIAGVPPEVFIDWYCPQHNASNLPEQIVEERQRLLDSQMDTAVHEPVAVNE
jgi:hypothetical protein